MNMRFTKAIVRQPGKSLIHGVTSATLGTPNYALAVDQHQAYMHALKRCSVDVISLPANEAHPDSVFMEDVALLTDNVAIVSRPGAPSRLDEVRGMTHILEPHFENVESIVAPGTVEAGDIMMVGSHFYIGLSQRTNASGADQMISILERYGKTASTIKLEKVLHLKTGLAYLEHNNLVACGEFVHHPEFQKYNIIEIHESESYAANCIWVNDKVLIPQGYPQAKQSIQAAGYDIIELDVSEFKKLDGGLSCLSLRF